MNDEKLTEVAVLELRFTLRLRSIGPWPSFLQARKRQRPETSYQLPVTSYQLSVISYQLSVISCEGFTITGDRDILG